MGAVCPNAVLPVKICGKACLTGSVSRRMVSFRQGTGDIANGETVLGAENEIVKKSTFLVSPSGNFAPESAGKIYGINDNIHLTEKWVNKTNRTEREGNENGKTSISIACTADINWRNISCPSRIDSAVGRER